VVAYTRDILARSVGQLNLGNRLSEVVLCIDGQVLATVQAAVFDEPEEALAVNICQFSSDQFRSVQARVIRCATALPSEQRAREDLHRDNLPSLGQ